MVAPSTDQTPFLEATLASVASQGYPNPECIVIGGGSTGSSIEIVHRYELQCFALVRSK